MDTSSVHRFRCKGSTKQLNSWLESSLSYWVTVGAGELEGGEYAVGVFNGDAGAGEFNDGDELGAKSFFRCTFLVFLLPNFSRAVVQKTREIKNKIKGLKLIFLVCF